MAIKVIKPGIKSVKSRYVYLFVCPACGCIFDCETEDFKKIEKRLDGDATIDCPTCGVELHRITDCSYSRREVVVERSSPSKVNPFTNFK